MAKKKERESRAEAEIGARAGDEPYLCRIRIWGADVRVACLEGLTCFDVDLSPQQIKNLAGQMAGGADKKRPLGPLSDPEAKP